MNDNLPPGCTQADIDRRYRDPEDQHADAVMACSKSCRHWEEFLAHVGTFFLNRNILASEGDLWAIMQGFEDILYSETADARKELEEAGFYVPHLPPINERNSHVSLAVNTLLAARSV